MPTIHRFSALLAIPLIIVAIDATAADSVATLDAKFPCDKPVYPRASLVNEEQGTVVMQFLVAIDGQVTDTKIEKSSGFKNLDRAALKLAQCKFKPVVKDGKPEQSWTKFEYAWSLS